MKRSVMLYCVCFLCCLTQTADAKYEPSKIYFDYGYATIHVPKVKCATLFNEHFYACMFCCATNQTPDYLRKSCARKCAAVTTKSYFNCLEHNKYAEEEDDGKW